MSTPSAKLLVLVGQKFACVKIVGRANFTSSVDFRALMNGLLEKGYSYFVLDLAECLLMDSTFLGVLAGLGLKLKNVPAAGGPSTIELLNPNPRVAEVLENLGILHLFTVTQGSLRPREVLEPVTPAPVNPSKEEVTRACLEAHQTLMAINPENIARFKDVASFLAEDLQRLKKDQPSPS